MATIGFEGPKKIRIGTDIHQGYVMYGKAAVRDKDDPAPPNNDDYDDSVPF
jgi:hypothetical protein